MKKEVMPASRKLALQLSAIAALALAAIGAQAAGDAAGGAQKAKEVCAPCHGADGNSPSNAFPRLAGQWESYLYQALSQYKSGERKNAIMAPQAANLTEQEMRDLAAYYSEQKAALFVLPRD